VAVATEVACRSSLTSTGLGFAAVAEVGAGVAAAGGGEVTAGFAVEVVEAGPLDTTAGFTGGACGAVLATGPLLSVEGSIVFVGKVPAAGVAVLGAERAGSDGGTVRAEVEGTPARGAGSNPPPPSLVSLSFSLSFSEMEVVEVEAEGVAVDAAEAGVAGLE